MPKYIIFTTVKNDGVGDFTHFEDIVKAINADTNFADVELLLVVDIQRRFKPDQSNDSLYESLLSKIDALGHKYILNFTDDHIYNLANTEPDSLIADFADVKQALIISYDMIFRHYEKYLPKDIVVKFIPEHDGALNKHPRLTHINNETGSNRNIMVRGMGLSNSRQAYGVKVPDLALPTQAEAIQALQTNDAEFLQCLLTATETESMEQLLEKNVIIPAYFSHYFMLPGFIEAITANPAFLADKNIIIYHSGFNISNIDMRYQGHFQAMLAELSARSIQAYFPDGCAEISSSQSGDKTIRIFNRFYVSDPGYKALFSLAPLVGVSGDNSLELAIASKKLPFYWSTNATYKNESYAGLVAIAKQPRLHISSDARESFIKFFELSKETFENIEDYQELNLQAMIDEWPIFADYIKENHNFYDKLSTIICENLPRQSLPSALRNIPEPRSFLGLFGIYSENNQAVDMYGRPINLNAQILQTSEQDCFTCVIS